MAGATVAPKQPYVRRAEDNRTTIAGITIPDIIVRILVGVLTAALIAFGGIIYQVYDDSRKHGYQIAALEKADAERRQEIAETRKEVAALRKEIAELKEDLTQSNADFHQAAIGKINELLARRR